MNSKKIYVSTLTVLAMAGVAGVAAVTPTANAATKRAVTPKSLRGTWQQRTKKNGVSKIKITKYTFSVADYKKGKKEGSWMVGDKKKKGSKNPFNGLPLYVKKDKKGYTFIGRDARGQIWHLKRVTHKKRQALRDDGWAYKSFGEKPVVSYYYRVK
ncbi:hypothetical protein [Levilactobacillus suantsaiihabitans]|uniref:Uncharacterized protein n=1 Tax=Levilactobacillus suantsaiihabitans TaxID=2487722 RepID=A0A4Z0J621_9LACO|nr:hypothetical protein [Levilactobacillus suantsaiihabitans]TGD17975.1 hypothetical protein EGT51_10405 [Levilactobacillus suantsaiihabitans]